jgi:hypothetical protein
MKVNIETSAAKSKANRQNSLKSTGPKSETGKKVVSQNPLKHGLLASALVLKTDSFKESEVEFRGLLADLAVELQPVGCLEELQVERIASCYWRLRRVARAESGHIRAQLDGLLWRVARQKTAEYEVQKELLGAEDTAAIVPTTTLMCDFLIGVLEDTRDEIVTESAVGDQTQRVLKRLLAASGLDIGFICSILSGSTFESAKGPLQQHAASSPAISPDQAKSVLVGLLDREIDRIGKIRRLLAKNHIAEVSARILSSLLPERDDAEKILRYETSIERQLWRAIGMLERLQARRLGLATPAWAMTGTAPEN